MQALPKRIVVSLLPRDGAEALSLLKETRSPDSLVELRGDLLNVSEWEQAIRSYSEPLLVAIRRKADGGVWPGSEADRIERLKLASELGVRWVDVECDAEWRPWEQTSSGVTDWIVSDHGLPCEAKPLQGLWQQLRRLPVSGIKIVPVAKSLSENRAIYDLLQSRQQSDPSLIAFAMGESGRVSRMLAATYGSPWHYAAASHAQPTAPGQFSAPQLQSIYRPFEMDRETRLFGLLGRSLTRSPSPAMHQAAYDDAGLNARYLPFEAKAFSSFVEGLENGSLGALRAVGVTMPFKEDAAAWAGRLDPWAERTGAVNTLTQQDGEWVGWNTDAPAACEWAEQTLGDLTQVRVRVLGAGGTARALGAALKFCGARVEWVARDTTQAERIAAPLGGTTLPWSARTEPGWDLLVQATPLGADGERWFEQQALGGGAVLDAVYRDGGTALTRDADAQGLAVWQGLDLLVAQGFRQYELMTGVPADPERMRQAAEAFLRHVDAKIG